MSKTTATKDAIIQSAIAIFSKKGFANSTISEIAGKANVAEGTIYKYFKNKEDLFFTIPVEKTKEFCRELELHSQGIDGSLNKIKKFIWYYLYFFKSNPKYARTLMLEMRVSKNFAKHAAYRSFKPFTLGILEIIREGQKEGSIRKDGNIYLLRQMILGILEHMVTRWLVKGEKYDLMEHYGEVTELIFQGICETKK
jgi:TetR/AcrR family fatty acid metabolism transcriptional regulator